MPLRADFLDGQVLFQQLPSHPRDLTRYQEAMFLDRPDLWPVRRPKRKNGVPPEQRPLFDSEDSPG